MRVLLARQRDGVLCRFPIWDDVRTFDGKPVLTAKVKGTRVRYYTCYSDSDAAAVVARNELIENFRSYL